MHVLPVTGNSLVNRIEYGPMSYDRETQTGQIPYVLLGDNGERIERIYNLTTEEGLAWEQDYYLDNLILIKEGFINPEEPTPPVE